MPFAGLCARPATSACDDLLRCLATRRVIEICVFNSALLKDGMTMHAYWYSGGASCSIKSQRTGADARRVKRWGHEAVLNQMQ